MVWAVEFEYFDMIRVRKMEYAIFDFFKKGIAPASTHLAMGEEATEIGLLSQLRKEDFVVATCRGHVAALR